MCGNMKCISNVERASELVVTRLDAWVTVYAV